MSAEQENNPTTPRMNFSEKDIVPTTPLSAKMAYNKQAIEHTTPTFRKYHGQFQIKTSNGKWVMANVYGKPTNDPNRASVRAQMASPLFTENTVSQSIALPNKPSQKGGRTYRRSRRSRNRRRSRHYATRSKKSK